LDGVQLAQLTAAPYTHQWDTTQTSNGPHTITVIAEDAAGNTAQVSIQVTVDNPITTGGTETTTPAPLFPTPILIAIAIVIILVVVLVVVMYLRRRRG